MDLLSKENFYLLLNKDLLNLMDHEVLVQYKTLQRLESYIEIMISYNHEPKEFQLKRVSDIRKYILSKQSKYENH